MSPLISFISVQKLYKISAFADPLQSFPHIFVQKLYKISAFADFFLKRCFSLIVQKLYKISAFADSIKSSSSIVVQKLYKISAFADVHPVIEGLPFRNYIRFLLLQMILQGLLNNPVQKLYKISAFADLIQQTVLQSLETI